MTTEETTVQAAPEITPEGVSVAPTAPGARIVSLDVLRGVALLGILILNIVGMGMLSSAYFHPYGSVSGAGASSLDLLVWHTNELLFEGSMRALFSMLFGAGVVLFVSNKSGRLHYRRTFWLLMFGLFDGFLLLWSGDILVVYALAGALLYFVRDTDPRRLLVCAAVLMLFLFGIRLAINVGLEVARTAHLEVVATQTSGAEVSQDQLDMAEGWTEFAADGIYDDEQIAEELELRRGSYLSAFAWNAVAFAETLGFVLPLFMLWDALNMMLLGMALYKLGVLQGARSKEFYQRLALAGLAFGLLINGYEANRIIASNYDVLVTYSFLNPTYDLGRLGLGLGYMGLVLWWCQSRAGIALRGRLAAVGRMALTNYLMHSLIAVFLFTGAGFALVGTLERWMLYPIVLLIWLFQLWFSPWWLARHKQGPLEALWRRLTYGS